MPKVYSGPPPLFFQRHSVVAQPGPLEDAGRWCSLENGFRMVDPTFENPEVIDRIELARPPHDPQLANAPPLLLSGRDYEQLGTTKIDGQNIHHMLMKGAVLTIDDPWTELPIHTRVDGILQVRTACEPGDVLEVDTMRPMYEGIQRLKTWSYVDANERRAVRMEYSSGEDTDAEELRRRANREIVRMRYTAENHPAAAAAVGAAGTISDPLIGLGAETLTAHFSRRTGRTSALQHA
ncbi:hypothetical protein BDY19DRAFT_910620 [Irpex rosettiformis]|uniref:Uncharacterized protein n=1 Tax=Irpex rosettiformis TaxID=378272 RepID=A0ACB8TN52_9APHY|nr:hypothetical protein BDY19DRAFT_910620 [Irpex rosettiformis]